MEPKVWIRSRKLKSGKTSYHLRWIDPNGGGWKSRAAGPDGKTCTDIKKAQRAAADLEGKLSAGTYTEIRPVMWCEFVEEHCRLIPGEGNRSEAQWTLEEFGELINIPLRRLRFADVERYVETLRAKKKQRRAKGKPVVDGDGKPVMVRALSDATINKKLRYLRAAFNKAVKRGYLGKNPLDGWNWQADEETEIREITSDEETAILDAAEDLYGDQARAFVLFALNTGGRRGELLKLKWEDIDLDGGSVLFTHTKGRRDRRVYFAADVADALRPLRLRLALAAGPFVGMADNLGRRWERIRKAANLPDVSIHDLRRTYITRLFRGGESVPVVMKLAGHRNYSTTQRYYAKVANEDAKASVEKLRRGALAG